MSRRGCARHNARRDQNEPEIVQALEAQGFHVDRINGKGLPDLLVSKAGRMWLAEVKMPKGTFKPAQNEWRTRWTGPPPITLRSVEDAQRFCLLAMAQEAQDARALAIGRRSLEREQQIADAMGEDDEAQP